VRCIMRTPMSALTEGFVRLAQGLDDPCCKREGKHVRRNALRESKSNEVVRNRQVDGAGLTQPSGWAAAASEKEGEGLGYVDLTGFALGLLGRLTRWRAIHFLGHASSAITVSGSVKL
jgi:hypothetical protein